MWRYSWGPWGAHLWCLSSYPHHTLSTIPWAVQSEHFIWFYDTLNLVPLWAAAWKSDFSQFDPPYFDRTLTMVPNWAEICAWSHLKAFVKCKNILCRHWLKSAFLGPLTGVLLIEKFEDPDETQNQITINFAHYGFLVSTSGVIFFLDASSHLYKRVCPSVRMSVRP